VNRKIETGRFVTTERASKGKKKCMFHPGLECPNPDGACIFVKPERVSDVRTNRSA
jgi:hypothetical protein